MALGPQPSSLSAAPHSLQAPEKKKKTTLFRKLSEKRAHKYEFMQQQQLQQQLQQHQQSISRQQHSSSSSSSSSSLNNSFSNTNILTKNPNLSPRSIAPNGQQRNMSTNDLRLAFYHDSDGSSPNASPPATAGINPPPILNSNLLTTAMLNASQLTSSENSSGSADLAASAAAATADHENNYNTITPSSNTGLFSSGSRLIQNFFSHHTHSLPSSIDSSSSGDNIEPGDHATAKPHANQNSSSSSSSSSTTSEKKSNKSSIISSIKSTIQQPLFSSRNNVKLSSPFAVIKGVSAQGGAKSSQKQAKQQHQQPPPLVSSDGVSVSFGNPSAVQTFEPVVGAAALQSNPDSTVNAADSEQLKI